MICVQKGVLKCSQGISDPRTSEDLWQLPPPPPPPSPEGSHPMQLFRCWGHGYSEDGSLNPLHSAGPVAHLKVLCVAVGIGIRYHPTASACQLCGRKPASCGTGLGNLLEVEVVWRCDCLAVPQPNVAEVARKLRSRCVPWYKGFECL